MNPSKLALVFTATCLMMTGCATEPGQKTAYGAGIGAAAGAVAGAVIGHQTGNRNQGALIGAALGGGLGAVVGNRMDKQAKELAKIAETKRTEQGIITKLKSDILFDTGKADLKESAEANLKKMAAILKKYPENVLTVRGYTDSTGSDKVNKPLSEKRAAEVKERIVAGGVPASTVSAVGMGPENPVADNKSAAGRSQNRRVEVEITVDESKVPKDAK
jgi:outer membrane protein OmpA-like peptidoglycan-associated protein